VPQIVTCSATVLIPLALKHRDKLHTNTACFSYCWGCKINLHGLSVRMHAAAAVAGGVALLVHIHGLPGVTRITSNAQLAARCVALRYCGAVHIIQHTIQGYVT
jgi:hypothetical protein